MRLSQRGFFDFSFPELVITFGVALVVLGPKKLPGLVQQVGRWVGRARHMARQFREQLESEVNSISEVKPVPRHVAPEVGPVAPTTPAPEVAAAESVTPAGAPEAAEHAAPAEGAAPIPASEPSAPQVAGSEVHPESQIYFALNGTEPTVVAENPFADPGTPGPLPATEAAPAVTGEGQSAEAGAPPKREPAQPASVPVIFPHDHG